MTIGNISTNTAFSDTSVNFFAKITNKADDTDYVELEVIGAMVSSTGSSNFTTKLSTTTIIKLKEVKDGAVSTYQRAMKKTISDADLHFNLQDIVDNLDNSNITAGLNRMKGYLNVANRSYDVEMKITGLGNPSISGTINVQ